VCRAGRCVQAFAGPTCRTNLPRLTKGEGLRTERLLRGSEASGGVGRRGERGKRGRVRAGADRHACVRARHHSTVAGRCSATHVAGDASASVTRARGAFVGSTDCHGSNRAGVASPLAVRAATQHHSPRGGGSSRGSRDLPTVCESLSPRATHLPTKERGLSLGAECFSVVLPRRVIDAAIDHARRGD